MYEVIETESERVSEINQEQQQHKKKQQQKPPYRI